MQQRLGVIAAGGSVGRALRNHRQCQRLGELELAYRLAEIDKACRCDSLDVFADGNQV